MGTLIALSFGAAATSIVAPAALGYSDAWVGKVYNRTWMLDPCFTSGVPTEEVLVQECESKEAPTQHHNWKEAEDINYGSVNVYPSIAAYGASGVRRGIWSVEYEVEPGTGIYVPNLGVETWWPVVCGAGQSNSKQYTVKMYGWEHN
jgi:hypothetical protein